MDPGQCFKVGRHLVRLVRLAGVWAASVDGLSVGDRFPSQNQAWQEGVRTAQALDAPPPRPPAGALAAPHRTASPLQDAAELAVGDG